MSRQKTLGELRRDGVDVPPVREELRRNLICRLRAGEPIVPGVIGYDDTVFPEIENALLAGHHMVFLGERGQAKSRIIRGLVGLLDEVVPVVADCEIHDNPFKPICFSCRRRFAEEGDALPITWIDRSQRFGEKLATPDVSIADLIGEIDPVKLAEGRYLADEETVHYGLVPRTNRGIFAINELPDLSEKIQVGLFNVMEEKDLQIKGFKIRLPLDVVIVASANPEDYTSRGRIITPLKDRFDVQIRTHYPHRLEDELAIMEQEVPARAMDLPLRVPKFLKQIVARLTLEARECSEINHASGVSVRVTINNYESLLSNAEKRAVRLDEPEIVPRISDLPSVFASTAGKIEFDDFGEDHKPEELIERLLNQAILRVFDDLINIEDLVSITKYFEQGWGVEVSDIMPSEQYLQFVRTIPGLRRVIEQLGPFESPGLMAAATELVLEGLHLHEQLNKAEEGSRYVYRA